MNKMKHVYEFELAGYFKSKSYILSTLLICIAAVLAMTLPRIIDSGTDTDDSGAQGESTLAESVAVCDPLNMISDEILLTYGKTDIQRKDSEGEVKEAVQSEAAAAGIVVRSVNEFDYYVFNRSMFDDSQEMFRDLMSTAAKMKYCGENGLQYDELVKLDNASLICNENILGKDSEENYWYSYVLVILVFMVIIMYGMMIATSVVNEKSNRTVEILVTSTSPSSLLFGKVLAGATAILFQMGLIFCSVLGAYQFNKEYLGVLETFLDIPVDVLVTFAVFGLGGFLFYAFMYGALGAMVSKVEDLNKTAGTAQMLIMIVYFIVLFTMQQPDGIVIRVLSFLPVSAYSAMFIRIAMGRVDMWEIVLSAVILYASVVGMGFISAKIFRNSTLRYGNPISIVKAVKGIRSRDNE